MILYLKKIYKNAKLNIPDEHRREFTDHLTLHNLSRLKFISYFTILLIPFILFYHFKIAEAGYCTKYIGYCPTLFLNHYLLIFFSYLFLFIRKWLRKGMTTPSVRFIINLYLILHLLSYTSTSLSSQMHPYGNIIFYSTGSVFIASLIINYKRTTFFIYSGMHLYFLFFFFQIQKSNGLLLYNGLYASLGVVFAISLNFIFFQYKMKDFLRSKKLKVKNKEINETLNMIKKDLFIAQKIQQRLLQSNIEKMGRLRIHSKYVPVDEIGGDFYDISELKRNGVRFFLADATGHGIQAALITMAIKAEYEALKNNFSSPKKLLKELNNEFLHKFGTIQSLFSCIVVDVYPEKGKLVYSSAGHPDQILQRKNWSITRLSRTGKIIGIAKDVEFEERELNFENGEKLFLYTDGLYEEFNSAKEEFGEDQLISLIKSYSDHDIDALFEAVKEDIYSFIGSKQMQDDITFLGIEFDSENEKNRKPR